MSNDSSVASTLRPFVAGGLASIISSLCMHPVDLTSVRMHSPTLVAEESGGIGTIKIILKDEGVRGFFSGLSASIIRHGVYGGFKIGLHDYLSEKLKKLNDNQPLPMNQKVFAAASAGVSAAIFGNPFDIVLVRMLADNNNPLPLRHNYRNPFRAMVRISKEEGVKTLWRGCTPMLLSSVAMNVGMLAIYDEVKDAAGLPVFPLHLYLTYEWHRRAAEAAEQKEGKHG